MNAVAALACALALSTGTAAEDHLVAGAVHFREARYAEALVEFRVAQKLGVRGAAAYAGAALVKLERFEDAIEAFGSEDTDPGDALLDYYRALACHGARLYVCADAILARIGTRSGPKLSDQAARIRSDLAVRLAAETTQEAIERHAARCAELERERRTIVARAHCAEAKALAKRRSKAESSSARAAGDAEAGGRP